MSKGMNVLGGVLCVVGALWALQGIGLVGGSFMTGQRHWLVIGIVTALVGAGCLAWGNLGRRS